MARGQASGKVLRSDLLQGNDRRRAGVRWISTLRSRGLAQALIAFALGRPQRGTHARPPSGVKLSNDGCSLSAAHAFAFGEVSFKQTEELRRPGLKHAARGCTGTRRSISRRSSSGLQPVRAAAFQALYDRAHVADKGLEGQNVLVTTVRVGHRSQSRHLSSSLSLDGSFFAGVGTTVFTLVARVLVAVTRPAASSGVLLLLVLANLVRFTRAKRGNEPLRHLGRMQLLAPVTDVFSHGPLKPRSPGCFAGVVQPWPQPQGELGVRPNCRAQSLRLVRARPREKRRTVVPRPELGRALPLGVLRRIGSKRSLSRVQRPSLACKDQTGPLGAQPLHVREGLRVRKVKLKLAAGEPPMHAQSGVFQTHDVDNGRPLKGTHEAQLVPSVLVMRGLVHDRNTSRPVDDFKVTMIRIPVPAVLGRQQRKQGVDAFGRSVMRSCSRPTVLTSSS